MRLTRRSLLGSGFVAGFSPVIDQFGVPMIGSAAAQGNSPERDWRHALSLFGELKYPPHFKHFDYVNPAAPKTGSARMIAFGTFDNFNEVVAGLKGPLRSAPG